MNKLKSLFIITAFSLLSQMGWAATFTVDGITYYYANNNSTTAQVNGLDKNYTSTILTIPGGGK